MTLIDELVAEILVLDDSSDPPAWHVLQDAPDIIRRKTRVVDQPGDRGYIVGRNTLMRLASHDYVLSMDDDAYVIDEGAVRRAVRVLQEHPDVAAVACAQAEADGSLWPVAMQPSRAGYPCVITAYIGFAQLLRRSTFLSLGGYRESFHFYGEEKDYCMRLLEAGHRVVYLPDARVAHVPDRAGRSDARYLRYVIRNDCLCALYNEPLPLPLLSVPLRLTRYAVMRRHGSISDPGGMRWILGELSAALPAVWRERSPMRWVNLRRWHQLRATPASFEAPA
jgi:GT2 family glycosyltransferase